MKAVAWHGKRDVRVDTVPDPSIEAPTDAIVRITSTGICGSDLHLYEETKRALARQQWEATNHYSDAKGAVVAEILTRARRWAASRR